MQTLNLELESTKVVADASRLSLEINVEREEIDSKLSAKALGPNAGRKALTLQAVPVSENQTKTSVLVSKQSSFSLHAGVACKSNQRKKLERLYNRN